MPEDANSSPTSHPFPLLSVALPEANEDESTTYRDGASITSKTGFDGATREVLPGLRRFARGLARDAAKGDDIVQDTLVNAWAARQSFQQGTNFKAWLFRIARNSFISEVRRSRPSLELTPDLERRLLVMPAPQEEKLLSRDLAKAMASLSRPQALALLLVTEDALTYEQAALHLQIGVGAVKSRVGRARAGILAYLAHDNAVKDELLDDITVALPDLRTPSGLLMAKHGQRYLAWKASGIRWIG